jgi:ketosteroid isomerase-like protein
VHRITEVARYVRGLALKSSLPFTKLKLRQTNKEHKMSNFPSAAELLHQSLDTFLAKDMKAWSLLCADDIIAEFPFAPEGSPTRLQGREALYRYLHNHLSVIDVHSIPHLRIYATDDPNVAIAEWSSSGDVLTNGNAHEMSYATFVTCRDGLIVSYREYCNPIASMQAMSGAPF